MTKKEIEVGYLITKIKNFTRAHGSRHDRFDGKDEYTAIELLESAYKELTALYGKHEVSFEEYWASKGIFFEKPTSFLDEFMSMEPTPQS